MTIPWLHVGMAALLIVIALPLIARKVPMNRYMGFRLGPSMASDENWYAVNAYGGKCLLAFAVGLAVFAVLTWTVAPPVASELALLYIALPFLGLLPVLVLVNWFAQEL